MRSRPAGRLACAATAVVALGLGFLVGPLAGDAAAHAVLTSTTPTTDEVLQRAPDSVTLIFDEPVEVVAGAVRVIDPEGDRVDRGSVEDSDGGRELVAAIDANRQGTYTVAWRALSGDGHNLSGSFLFHVGTRTGAADFGDDGQAVVEVVGAVGRWLAFAGMLTAGGAVLVSSLAGVNEARVRERTRRIAIGAGAAGAAGVAAVLIAQAAEASGRGLGGALGLTAELAADTRTGVLTSARGLCLLAVAVVSSVGAAWRRIPWPTGALVLGSVVLLALSGHAWTSERRWLAVATDVSHLAAVAVWLGGVVALVLTLRAADNPSRLGRRFSAAALVSAIAVALTGTTSAFFQLGTLEALTATGYGQLLLAKIVGFGALLWFGWTNRRQLVPLLERASAPLLRSMRVEVVLAVAVLAVTAVLVDQPPGRDQLVEPFGTTLAADDMTVQVTVGPARVGANDIHLYFFDDAGTGPEPVDAVEMTAAVGDVPPRRLTITPVTATHVSAYGALLASPGTWTLQVTAVRAGTPTTFSVEVPIR